MPRAPGLLKMAAFDIDYHAYAYDDDELAAGGIENMFHA